MCLWNKKVHFILKKSIFLEDVWSLVFFKKMSHTHSQKRLSWLFAVETTFKPLDNFNPVFCKFWQIWTSLNNWKHVRTCLDFRQLYTGLYNSFRHVKTGLWKYGSLSLEQVVYWYPQNNFQRHDWNNLHSKFQISALRKWNKWCQDKECLYCIFAILF